MVDVLKVVTVHSTRDDSNTLSQNAFPFCVRDVALPQCRTGFVYMLLSLKDSSFAYIGETICIRERIISHNSGYGTIHGENISHLRPFALIAFICGFEGNTEMRKHIRSKWEDKHHNLRCDGVTSPMEWAKCGSSVISDNDMSNNLSLICLFR